MADPEAAFCPVLLVKVQIKEKRGDLT